MKLRSLLPLIALCAGCQTVGGNRGTVLAKRPQTGSGSRATSATSGWDTAPAVGNPAAREATRVAELESRVARLQAQLDSMSAAQETVIAQASATVSRSGSVADSLRPELDSLRAEVAALKAENRALREEQAAQRSQIAALPDKVTRAVVASLPKGGGGSSGSRGGSGRSRECYEHVVAQGDTVSDIASAYHVTVADIVRENNLKDASAIRIGQTLYVPKK